MSLLPTDDNYYIATLSQLFMSAMFLAAITAGYVVRKILFFLHILRSTQQRHDERAELEHYIHIHWPPLCL